MKYVFATVVALSFSAPLHAEPAGSSRSDEACRKIIEGFKEPSSWDRKTVSERFREFKKVCFGKEYSVKDAPDVSNQI